MYATRYAPADKGRPLRMGAAVAINGGILAALLFAAPDIVGPKDDSGPIIIEHIPLPPDPPLVKPEPKAKTEPRDTLIVVPETPIRTEAQPPMETTPVAPQRPYDPGPPTAGTGTGDGGTVERVAPPPALIGASLDPRYADRLQPPYPAGEIRAKREGLVVVRVRIGTDGRVKAVEQVSAVSDALFDATRRQALGKWRFKPATRGGVAEESWKTMTVRFELKDL